MNNAYTVDLTPIFQWEPSTVAGGAPISYEIEYSTDLSFPAGSTTSAMPGATMFVVATPLAVSPTAPVGARCFWRVRAYAGAACSSFSSTWWVNIGRSDQDLNGDGFADIAIAGGGTTVWIYSGTMGGLPGAGADTMMFTTDFLSGWAVASGGDLGGDGFGDLAVGAPYAGAVTPGTTNIYYGGFADVLVGGPSSDLVATNAGAAYLYFGGILFNTVADATWLGANSDDYLGARLN